MKSICLDCYSPEEFAEILKKMLIETLKLEDFQAKKTAFDPLLTREEAATLLKITLPTLNTWTKQNVLKSHRIESRIYYKHSELMSALKKINHS